ncbi:MAG: peptidoglycan DD-metalloendopeptidase family protein [candidate division WOR-3 bacterium]
MRLFKFFLIFIIISGCKKKKNFVKESFKEYCNITVSYKLSKNESLEKVLLWKIPFISVSESYYFIKFFEKKVNTRKLKEGDRFIFLFSDEKKLKEVNFVRKDTPNVINRFFKDDKNGEFGFERVLKKIDVDTTLIYSKINSNLYESFQGYQGGEYLADFIADIFTWVIDFNTEVREGDEVTIFFERKFLEGEFISFGKVLYILYNGKLVGKKEAIYFNGNYYDSLGNSLEKYFLRSPLPYGRISSGFKKKRFHPILRIVRPHHGIDYAAPPGTPVLAVADGEVIFAGWKGGYGNFVKIRHKNGYITGYGHLKRISSFIRKGKRVKQGEIIGFVGSTGLSTGPHLHFEIKKDGKFLNFLNIKPPSKKKLDSKEKEIFYEVLKKIKEKMNEKRYQFSYNI